MIIKEITITNLAEVFHEYRYKASNKNFIINNYFITNKNNPGMFKCKHQPLNVVYKK